MQSVPEQLVPKGPGFGYMIEILEMWVSWKARVIQIYVTDLPNLGCSILGFLFGLFFLFLCCKAEKLSPAAPKACEGPLLRIADKDGLTVCVGNIPETRSVSALEWCWLSACFS